MARAKNCGVYKRALQARCTHLYWAENLGGDQLKVLLIQDLLNRNEDSCGLNGAIDIRDTVAAQSLAPERHPCA